MDTTEWMGTNTSGDEESAAVSERARAKFGHQPLRDRRDRARLAIVTSHSALQFEKA